MNRPTAVLFALLIAVSAARAQQLALGAPFQSHMVLQCAQPIRVWGTDRPRGRVTVEFAGHRAGADVGADGSWQVELPAVPAGGPHRLVARGSGEIVCEDVLAGELWLASGQSNMQWTLAQTGAADVIAAAADPKLRLLQLPRRAAAESLPDLGGARWQASTSDSAIGFSAVAFHFARALRERLRVPVGVIHASWGGTVAEAWTRPVALTGDELAPILQRAAAARPAGAKPPAEQHRPGALWHGMIAPVVRLRIRGVIWYQGESNAARAWQYRTLFPALIADWRAQFADAELPFLFVQLANFRADGDPACWPELREAQASALALPATGMAVAIDIGDPRDIHPKNKQEVGRRLALQAFARVYGDAGSIADGPILETARGDAGAMRLRFRSVGAGLVARGGELRGFEIAGADRRFHPATARLDGEQDVVVRAPEVPEPVAVRYAWAADPDATLANSAGLPAAPFRTDDWPAVTRGKR